MKLNTFKRHINKIIMQDESINRLSYLEKRLDKIRKNESNTQEVISILNQIAELKNDKKLQ